MKRIHGICLIVVCALLLVGSKTTIASGISQNYSDRQVNNPVRTAKVEESSTILSPQSIGSLTAVFNGQGFDTCEIPTASQMQTWYVHSPYKVVNLYIGGSHRACANQGLSASYVSQLAQQGWKFIPTWVGPQCRYFDISSNLDTAFNQGVNEANLAVAAAANLGLTLQDGSGSIIYYDLEGYDATNPGCRDAAKSFISGWVSQLHSLGNQAGVYGSSIASYMNDFVNITNPPDAVWLAHPVYSSYNQNATVWNVAGVPNTSWANHQRIRQYTQGHYEEYGNVGLNIDSNAIDGIVASSIYAQTYTLSGVVRDEGYVGVGGVTISITDQANQTRTTQSNADGTWSLGGFANGQYLVGYSKEGYQSLHADSVTVNNANVNIPNAYIFPVVEQYHYQHISQSPVNGTTRLRGECFPAQLVLKNDGEVKWYPGGADFNGLSGYASVRLGAYDPAYPPDYIPPVSFYDSTTWLNATRIQIQPPPGKIWTDPGDSVTINFRFCVPADAPLGINQIRMRPVIEYRGWMYGNPEAGSGIYWTINVVPSPPTAPSNLSAAAVSPTQINLTWTDNSNDEEGFKIERAPSGSSSWTQIATVGANVTSYQNTGLTCGTGYSYRVRAYNAGGDSGYSNTATATTVACAPTPSPTPTPTATPTSSPTPPSPTPTPTATPTSSPTPCGEFVCNGGFDGLSYWQSTENAVITSTGRTGSGVVVSYDGGNSDIYQLSPQVCAGGATCVVEAWCKAPAGSECRLWVGDANNLHGPPYENEVHMIRPGTGNWVQLLVSITPDHDEQLNIYLYAKTPGSAVVYDDVRGWVETRSNRRVDCGDFECGNTNAFQKYSLQAITTTVAHTGQYGMQLDVRPEFTEGAVGQTTYGHTPGEQVCITAWVRGTELATTTLRLYGHNHAFGNSHTLDSYVPLPNEWTQLRLPFLVDATGNIRIGNVVHGHDSIYMDDVNIGPCNAPTYPETLENHDFELGAGGWNISCLSTVDLTPGHTGYGVRSVQNRTTNQSHCWQGISQRVHVTPGQTYNIAAWLKWQSAAEVHIKIRWLDANDNELSVSYPVTGIPAGDSNGWEHRGDQVIAPTGAVAAEIIIWHGVVGNNQNVPGSTLWIDDVTFAPVEPEDTLVTLGVPQAPVNVGAVITIPVVISNAVNLGAFQVTVSYNPTLVMVENFALGEFLGSTGRDVQLLPVSIDNANGSVTGYAYTLGTEPDGPSGSGNLAYLRVRTLNDGVADLHLSNVQVTNVPGEVLPVATQDARLTILSCSGDFDGDGDVDIADIQMIAYRWQITAGHPLYEARYDLDNNGVINILDIQSVAYHLGTRCSSMLSNNVTMGVGAVSEAVRSASDTPIHVSVHPTTSTVEIGKAYTVSLMISDVFNLGAAEGVLSYNPSVIQITQIAPGEFPRSTGRTVISTNPIISPTAGTVTFGYYSTGATPPGPDGSGELFVVTYYTLAEGESHLTLSEVQVADISGKALTPLILHSGNIIVRPVQRVFLPLVIR